MLEAGVAARSPVGPGLAFLPTRSDGPPTAVDGTTTGGASEMVSGVDDGDGQFGIRRR